MADSSNPSLRRAESIARRSNACWRARPSCRPARAIRRTSSPKSSCWISARKSGSRRSICDRRWPRIARDRSCPTTRRGLAASLFGPSRVRADRTVSGQGGRHPGVDRRVDAAHRAADREAAPHGSHRLGTATRFSCRRQARAQSGRTRLRALAVVRDVSDGGSGGRRPRARRTRRRLPQRASPLRRPDVRDDCVRPRPPPVRSW